MAQKFASTERKLEKTTKLLEEENDMKRKLYQSMVKIAKELKVLREEQNHNLEVAKFQSQKWYDGGIWRCPDINPRVVADPEITRYQREPVSLTDLFFDLVTITAFTRVGDQIARNGEISYPTIAYFAVFWFIWMKETTYSTRFGTSDFVSQIETLLTCFAVLYGTFSISNDFMGTDSTVIMTAALIVATLHLLLHARIFLWFMKAEENTYGRLAKNYASTTMALLSLEIAVWLVGIFALPEDSTRRPIIFVLAILCSMRVPRMYLTNDFHGKCLF